LGERELSSAIDGRKNEEGVSFVTKRGGGVKTYFEGKGFKRGSGDS